MSSKKINSWKLKMEEYRQKVNKKDLKNDLKKAGFKITDKKIEHLLLLLLVLLGI